MSIRGFEKSIAIVILLGLTLGSITCVVHMSSTISRFQDQLLTTQQQLSELSDNYSQLQDQYENRITEQGPRYIGNPFTTQLWPGRLQAENITGMHWYSYNGTGLVNCTDNVLGLNGVELEGEYTTWTLVWKRNYGAGTDGIMTALRVDNLGNVYAGSYSGIGHIKFYNGTEVYIDPYNWFIPAVGDFSCGGGGSTTRKYVVGYDVNRIFDVWRYGKKIFTRDIQDDQAGIWGTVPIDISPNGKYIAVAAANGDGWLLLYEGS